MRWTLLRGHVVLEVSHWFPKRLYATLHTSQTLVDLVDLVTVTSSPSTESALY